MSIREFADRYIAAQKDAWQNGNFGVLEELEDENVIFHQEVDVVGREAHKNYIVMASQSVSELHQDWEYLTGAENIYALSYKATGVIEKEIPGTNFPVGKKVVNDLLFVFRLDNEKIAEAWVKGNMTVLD